MRNKKHILPLKPTHFVNKFNKFMGKGKVYFLRAVEHKKINKILAPNIAAAVIASTLIPASNTVFSNSNFSEVINNDKTTLVTNHGIENPVEPIKVNQGFYIFHPGVDLGGYLGEEIHPIMTGLVSDIQYSPFGYGNAVIVSHGGGLTSLYAHMSKIFVNLGEQVETKTVLGLMGSTGHSTGTHLHLEIRQDNIPQNPFNFLPSRQ
ncbi:MAG: M23 family metallopeptidase [Candidatus Woesebacteria bacterium]|nr:MAG: M23 family metallopeptidase [Candidatus Woesebacteria bacterium]